ncbi:MAG TPA: hypothetical protein VGB43_02640, partial [Flavobacterium sp.]
MNPMIKRLFLLFLGTLFIAACQQEEKDVAPSSFPESLRSLLMRVSQYPTSMDNVIDNTSCFGIKLPVSLVVNDQQLTIYSEAGYSSVLVIFNQSASDDDYVNLIFPLTIILKDFEEIVVESQQELDAIISNCEEDNGVSEIRCVNINYPLIFTTYSSNVQLAGTMSINNDAELYNYLNNGAEDYFMDVIYPVTLTNGLGQTTVVDSNAAFE